MRLLVCGGRFYRDECKVFHELHCLRVQHGIEVVIHGDATGADSLARKWAGEKGIPEARFPVTKEDWSHIGKSAGPIRNQKMIDDGKPTQVIAFGGGNGTADMIRRARRAGLPVIEIDREASQ